jgi:hypothetical protein
MGPLRTASYASDGGCVGMLTGVVIVMSAALST